ncbi:septal ring lytic transglycosylase RlpA family protein [Dechloromonas sp. ZY10]|uniref:septal ring lytic transglycosylase RlpA family protein n=1 Tax=Dechloromonas aquae TaxID=2664436 RepID=UPI003527A0AD
MSIGLRLLWPALTLGLLAACGSTPPAPEAPPATVDRAKPVISKTPTRKPSAVLKRGGGFYKDDGPGEEIPDGLDDIPDAVPKWEPLHKPALKPYVVLGKEYVPNTSLQAYKARGIASWYGRKFHGQKTSIGEPYDMFAMTAAHPTLALPSYVRVTSPSSGQSVIVRVTDRGPFHAGRIIDLSYTAAYKLGLINGGSGEVEVEAILPGDYGNATYAQVGAPASSSPAPSATVIATTAGAARSKAGADEIEQLAQRMAHEERPVQTLAQTGMSGESAAKGNVWLQLGAFASPDNAENLKSHLARDLDWLAEPLRIISGGGLHRLQLGPYVSRSEADRVAERIRSTLGGKPTIIIR